MRDTARVLFFVLGLASTASCDRSKARRADWSPQGKRWAEMLVRQIPGALCSPGGYFLTCFTQAPGDCVTLATRQIEACLDLHPEYVPQTVNADTGREGGQLLGGCTGTSLEAELRSAGKFIDNPRCRDVEYWRRAEQEQADRIERGGS